MTVLEGIRVVELGAWVAGPGAGGLLADWGADVIKVEAPEGDPMRRLFAVLSGHGEPQSPPFDLDNRGKRSVVLDLRSEQGRHRPPRAGRDRRRVPHQPAARRRRAPRLRARRPARLPRPARLRPGVRLRPHRPGRPPGRLRPGGLLRPIRHGQPGGAAGPAAGGQRRRRGRPHHGHDDHGRHLRRPASPGSAPGRGQLVETSLLRSRDLHLGWDVTIQLRYGKHLPTDPRTAGRQPAGQPLRGGRRAVVLAARAGSGPALAAAAARRSAAPELAEDERLASHRRTAAMHAAELVAAARRDLRRPPTATTGPPASTSTTCGGRRSTRWPTWSRTPRPWPSAPSSTCPRARVRPRTAPR